MPSLVGVFWRFGVRTGHVSGVALELREVGSRQDIGHGEGGAVWGKVAGALQHELFVVDARAMACSPPG